MKANITLKGLHPNSTTVTAYCKNCGAPIKDYMQIRCDLCNTELVWDGVIGDRKSIFPGGGKNESK